MRKILLIIILFAISILAQAQATIGSVHIPKKGAILDIKEENSKGANSSKGLALPRVWLHNPTRLYIGKRAPYTNITNPDEMLAHAGLMVYNLNQCMITHKYESSHIGIHTWDGKEWVQTSKDTLLVSGVTKHYDQDNNLFLAGDFGDAGVWMLQNVKARKYAGADGKSKTGKELPSAPNPNTTIGGDNSIQWTYPGPQEGRKPNPIPEGALDIYDGTDPFYFNQHLAIGLLYSWSAAIGMENTGFTSAGGGDSRDQQQSTDDDQAPGPLEVETLEGGHIRGICPMGWHIPTDREWGKLEKELTENPKKYTDQGEPQIWEGGNHGWTSQINSYGTHSVNFQHQCGIPYSVFLGWASTLINCKSKPRHKGGFESLPVGSNKTRKLNNYGSSAYYWTASAFGLGASGYAWSREIGVNGPAVISSYPSRAEHMSIRCKQD